jgi:hypothetical protein
VGFLGVLIIAASVIPRLRPAMESVWLRRPVGLPELAVVWRSVGVVQTSADASRPDRTRLLVEDPRVGASEESSPSLRAVEGRFRPWTRPPIFACEGLCVMDVGTTVWCAAERG